MKLVIFNLLVFGFIFSGQAWDSGEVSPSEEISRRVSESRNFRKVLQKCSDIFYSNETVSECTDKFDWKELYEMKEVWFNIENAAWHRIDGQKESNALRNILSISSKPLFEIFRDEYKGFEFISVNNWRGNNGYKYPLLTSQIESVLKLARCDFIFYLNKADVNSCKEKFNFNEVSLMHYVLKEIDDDGLGRMDQLEARNALRNILSISSSSKHLLDVFAGFHYLDFESVKKWIEDNRDTVPLLTSQIESMFSGFYKERLCNSIFISKTAANLCNKFDLEEVDLMRNVLSIAFQDDDCDQINDQEKRNALRKILSISPGPLFYIFQDLLYYDDDLEFNLVQSWIEDNRDVDPSLTSQIERAVSYFLSLPIESQMHLNF